MVTERCAGVDEAGRGALAGPVVAAAVILDERNTITGLADSKKLDADTRELLAKEIKTSSISWAIGIGSVDEIDQLNILEATMLAMKRALESLLIPPDKALIDGNRIPSVSIPAQAIVRGDALEAAISASSIIAKVTRDHMMVQIDKQYPCYGFASHKGYGTPAHRSALQRLGVTPVHRKSFSPVKLCLNQLNMV